MSGIAGIVSLDGSPVTAAQIEALTARLKRRGPDGTHVVIDRQVAFGHTLLATTPEALVEILPFVDRPTGCTITADARIDNRDELMTALDLSNETRIIGDGELILRAYLEWGDQCAAHLLGDFAFAIWDPRIERLLCARDQIGMRQLIYHHEPGHRFVFATEANAIIALPDLDAPLNHVRVGDFLGSLESADLSSTFFRGIFRLPPAHFLTFDLGGLVVSRYWELSPQPILNLPSDQAYADAFHDLFTQAVQCRLRNAGPIGAMVSGGIDSNAVASVASGLLENEASGPLATFSAIGPDADNCPETRAILAAIRSPSFAPTTINSAALDAFQADLLRLTKASAEPFDASMVVIRAIYLAAQRGGIKIVLDGVGGDSVLASTFHSAFLLRAGQLRKALREARGERRFWGPETPVWRSVLAAAWQAFVPTPLRALRFRRARRSANRHFLDRARALAPLLDPADATERRRHYQRRDFEHDRIDRFTRTRTLAHYNLVVARERYDRVAADCAIEPRDPFLDLRLVHFCHSLPRNQLQRDGWPKWIMRRAMDKVVPAEVTWRPGKEHVGYRFTRAVMDSLIPSRADPAEPIDATALNERYENLYLSNWFAYMLQAGWAPGTVTKEGLHDDDR